MATNISQKYYRLNTSEGITQGQHVLVKNSKFVISSHFFFWNFAISTHNNFYLCQ